MIVRTHSILILQSKEKEVDRSTHSFVCLDQILFSGFYLESIWFQIINDIMTLPFALRNESCKPNYLIPFSYWPKWSGYENAH